MSCFVISNSNEYFIYLCTFETPVYAGIGSCNVHKVHHMVPSAHHTVGPSSAVLSFIKHRLCFVFKNWPWKKSLCLSTFSGIDVLFYEHFIILFSFRIVPCLLMDNAILFCSPVAQTVFSVFTEMKERPLTNHKLLKNECMRKNVHNCKKQNF